MEIKLLCVSKTTDKRILELFQEYVKRLGHYVAFNVEYIELKQKKTAAKKIVEEEGKLILNTLNKGTILVLLDEKGKSHSSKSFAIFLQKQMNSGIKQLTFVIGGAFGFSDAIYDRANHKVALSSMTFTHQMVRLFFIEQLYRGFTILKGEKYHH